VTVSKSIFVKRPAAAAFRHFTADIGRWWPLKEGMSFGAARAHEIFLEGRVGGRFFERYSDGEEFEVGRVTAFEPPARVVFSWRQPSWNAHTEVEVRFAAEGDGTRVTLEHRDWEALSDAARQAAGSYGQGWDFALSRYAA
jgi:uncharacterized protein YndB with AHSA1/START domain